jgi:hypothetical protein
MSRELGQYSIFSIQYSIQYSNGSLYFQIVCVMLDKAYTCYILQQHTFREENSSGVSHEISVTPPFGRTANFLLCVRAVAISTAKLNLRIGALQGQDPLVSKLVSAEPQLRSGAMCELDATFALLESLGTQSIRG